MRKWRTWLLGAVLTVGLSGCAFLSSLFGSFHEPTLRFDRAELRDLSLGGVTIDLHWILKNDNPIGVTLSSLSYAFAVENHPLVSGQPRNGVTVKANGASALEFPATVQFAALAATLETFLTKDKASYQASGSVGVNTPIGIINLPLSYASTFDVPKLPDIRPSAPQLNSISLTGAHLTFPLLVHNKNSFALPFNGLSGALQLGGSSVAASNIPASSALASGEQRTVNIGIDVNFLQSGMALYNAISNKAVDLSYKGSLNVAGINVPISVSQRFNLR